MGGSSLSLQEACSPGLFGLETVGQLARPPYLFNILFKLLQPFIEDIKLLLVLLLFFRQLSNLLVTERMGLFCVIACLELCLMVLGFLPQAGDGLAVGREMLSVGKLLQNGLALFLVACQEVGKLALCQHGHASELLEIKSHGIKNGLLHAVSGPIAVAYTYLPYWLTVF